jgi:hypothetical protein
MTVSHALHLTVLAVVRFGLEAPTAGTILRSFRPFLLVSFVSGRKVKVMNDPASIGGLAAKAPEPVVAAPEAIGFPRVHAVAKWTIIASLTLLAIMAAAFWTFVLGGFAASGFRASNPVAGTGASLVITPECAWPLGVNEQDARTVCRMFYNLTPEQRAWVLKTRK